MRIILLLVQTMKKKVRNILVLTELVFEDKWDVFTIFRRIYNMGGKSSTQSQGFFTLTYQLIKSYVKVFDVRRF